MASLEINVNNTAYTVDVDPEMPLLWVLRDVLGLTGTKYSCGIGLCGTCTVHVDGEAVHSCSVPVSAVGSRQVTTIEGLSPDGAHPLQQAWLAEQVSQCGYCQPGQIMTAAALLKNNPQPTDDEIKTAMSSALCRCGSYPRVVKAIRRVAGGGS
jgi:isoquinoline 1-oxidoreductase alpha subunit